MRLLHLFALIGVVLTVAMFAQAAEAASPAMPVELRVEYCDAPLGISVEQPRFFWQMKDDRRGAAQTAYQILVADDPKVLAEDKGNVWDSGKVESTNSIQVVFDGKALKPHTFYCWKVRIWDADGKPTAYSKPVQFSTGMFDAKDVEGQWVGPADPLFHPEIATGGVPKEAADFSGCAWMWYDDPARKGTNMPSGVRYFRKTVELPEGEEPELALATVVSDNEGLLYVNGIPIQTKLGFPVTAPINVTRSMKPGKNILATHVMNAGDNHNPAGICGKFVVRCASGKTFVFPIDETWLGGAQGAESWNKGDADLSKFKPLIKVADAGKGPWGKLSVSITRDYGVAQLRKEFNAKGKVKRATVHASALGCYKLHINGQPVADDYFTPGWTDYNKRVYYNTYDVTDLVKSEGPNAIGAELAAGWYAGSIGWALKKNNYDKLCRVFVQLELEMADGSRQTIVTDPTWKMKYGPRLESEFLAGETYDAQLETPGWSKPGFDDADWKAVEAVPSIDRPFTGYPSQPVKITSTLKPIKITEPKPGVFVYDLGQNFAGFARLKVKGPAGTKVQLRFAEMLNPDGTIYTTNLRRARCTDSYILKGDSAGEVWQPQFTFHGFRYVEVTGYPGRPTEEAITGLAINSNVPMTGTFTCSNPMVNRLYQNILWTQRANYIEVPTDCPQRDERLGWTGDAQCFVYAAAFNANIGAFFTKWLVDVDDAQRPAGEYPDVIPDVLGLGAGTAGWADAGTICPMAIHEVYDDTRVLAAHYDSMVKYIEYLQKHSENLIRPAQGYGDWLSIKADTPKDVMATAYFAQSVQLVAKAAKILGKKEDAAKFDKLADDVKAAFNREFVGKDGRIKGNTQTVYVLALAFNLLSPENQKLAAKYLVEDIQSRDNHLSTGFNGTAYLMPTLAKIGVHDTAYKLLLNDTFPSWGYSIKHGATSIWERWDGWTAEKGFQDPGMNSFAHYSFGAVARWMFQTAGGINMAVPGYRELTIAPKPNKQMTWVKADYDSIQGPISSHWKKADDGSFAWQVTVPANTTAMLVIPAKKAASVTEGGKPLSAVKGLKVLGADAEGVKVKAPAGSYSFVVAP